MNGMRFFAGMMSLLLFAPWAAAQSLVYLVSYGTTQASFRARFPDGIFGTTPDQRLAMLRRTLKNEIWSVSVADGKRTLLFSDEGMSNFELLPANEPSYAAIASGQAFLKAVERSWQRQPNPGAAVTPQGIYEISLDGSKRFRRLIDVQPNMSSVMLNLEGTKAAIYSLYPEGGKYTLYVYSLPDWKLQRSVGLNKAFEAHCRGCNVQIAGWLADGKTLFLVVDVGDEDDPEAGPNQVPGNYIVSEEGADNGSIPPTAGQMEMTGYERPDSFAARVIAQLASGNYVFWDYALKKVPQPKQPIQYESVLVITDGEFKTLKQIQTGHSGNSDFVLTADGKYVAFVEDRMTPDYQGERHVWAMNLETGAAKEMFVAPPPNPPTSPEPNVSVTILGWLDK